MKGEVNPAEPFAGNPNLPSAQSRIHTMNRDNILLEDMEVSLSGVTEDFLNFIVVDYQASTPLESGTQE